MNHDFEEWKKKKLQEHEAIPKYFDIRGNPIARETWSALMEIPSYQIIAKDIIEIYEVSTIWLGLNHAFSKKIPPVIFETMIFQDESASKNEELHMYQERYHTLEQALEGHKKACNLVGESILKEKK